MYGTFVCPCFNNNVASLVVDLITMDLLCTLVLLFHSVCDLDSSKTGLSPSKELGSDLNQRLDVIL